MKLRVFVTGATGYLGSAIAARLVRSGHDVWGLTRSADRGKAIDAFGARPVIGDLADPGEWLGPLQNCDAVVHAAYDGEIGPEQDQRALEAVRQAALDGRVRRLLYTSGTWIYGNGGGEVVDESTALAPLDLVRWRAHHEEIARDLSTHEVAAIVLRPGMVYGERRGILGSWFAEAREKKTVTIAGDGSQHWPMVHRDDVAEAYALALEYAEAGTAYVLVDESRHRVRELADAVAATTGAVVHEWPADQVRARLGAFGAALLNDLRATSAKARRELGWVPRHTSFVTEATQLWREWQAAHEATVP